MIHDTFHMIVYSIVYDLLIFLDCKNKAEKSMKLSCKFINVRPIDMLIK